MEHGRVIWTDGWLHAQHERPSGWTRGITVEEHSTVRRAILAQSRLALARAEAEALYCRLLEERLVADTAIRSLHLRLDAAEEFVRLATGLTFHPPGSLAHSQHLLDLAALVEERRRHQRPVASSLGGAR